MKVKTLWDGKNTAGAFNSLVIEFDISVDWDKLDAVKLALASFALSPRQNKAHPAKTQAAEILLDDINATFKR